MKEIINLTERKIFIPVPGTESVITIEPKCSTPIWEEEMLQWPSVQKLKAKGDISIEDKD